MSAVCSSYITHQQHRTEDQVKNMDKDTIMQQKLKNQKMVTDYSKLSNRTRKAPVKDVDEFCGHHGGVTQSVGQDSGQRHLERVMREHRRIQEAAENGFLCSILGSFLPTYRSGADEWFTLSSEKTALLTAVCLSEPAETMSDLHYLAYVDVYTGLRIQQHCVQASKQARMHACAGTRLG